jgi:hypothetical protein
VPGRLVDGDAADGHRLRQAAREADVLDGELHRPTACLGENSPDRYGHERAAGEVGASSFSGEAAGADRRSHRILLLGTKLAVARAPQEEGEHRVHAPYVEEPKRLRVAPSRN